MLNGIQHTVLLFTGYDDQVRPAVALCRLADRAEQAHPSLVRAYVITTERFADHPSSSETRIASLLITLLIGQGEEVCYLPGRVVHRRPTEVRPRPMPATPR